MYTHTRTHTQTKCHRYWPGMEVQVYGDIAVEMKSEKDKEDWTIREFKLSMVSTKPIPILCSSVPFSYHF